MLPVKSVLAIAAFSVMGLVDASPIHPARDIKTCPQAPKVPDVSGQPVANLHLVSYDDKYNQFGTCTYTATWNKQLVLALTSGLRPPYYPGTFARARTLNDAAYVGLTKYGDVVGEALDRDQRHWLLRKVHQGYVNLKDTVAYKSQVSQLTCAEWAYHTYAAVGQAAYDVASQDDLVNDAIDLDTVLFYAADPTSIDHPPVFTEWGASKSLEEAIKESGGSTGSAKPADWARERAVAQLNAANPTARLCSAN